MKVVNSTRNRNGKFILSLKKKTIAQQFAEELFSIPGIYSESQKYLPDVEEHAEVRGNIFSRIEKAAVEKYPCDTYFFDWYVFEDGSEMRICYFEPGCSVVTLIKKHVRPKKKVIALEWIQRMKEQDPQFQMGQFSMGSGKNYQLMEELFNSALRVENDCVIFKDGSKIEFYQLDHKFQYFSLKC